MRRPVRNLSAAVMLLFVFVAASPPSIAQEAGIAPEKNLAAELKKLADVCYKCGESAREKGIYNYARSFYDYALRYDVDHKDTRQVMGYRKKGKDRVLIGELCVPRTNTCKPGTEKQLLIKLWAETLSAREKAADGLMKFVNDKKLDINQRLLALHHVLLICDTHAGARAVLRHSRPRGPDLWVNVLDLDAFNARADWTAAAKVQRIPDKTPYEEKLGLEFSKYRGERVVLHARAGNLSGPMAENCARMGDAAFVRAHTLLGVEAPAAPAADANRLHYTIFNEREEYARFVEQCSGIEDPNTRKEAAKTFGCSTRNPAGTVWLNTNNDDDESQRDAVAHAVGSLVLSHYCHWNLYWLTRGFAYTMSNQMMGSTKATVFTTTRSSAPIVDSGGINSLLGLGTTADGWRFRVLRAAAMDKLATLTQMTQAQSGGYDEQRMAQAFCMTEFLLMAHKDKMRSFFKTSREERVNRAGAGKAAETPAQTQERLLKELGLEESEFNKALRDWVLANYVTLPA